MKDISELTSDLSLTFEEVQNTLILRTQEQLFKYIKSGDWISKQLGSLKSFQNSLLRITNQEIGKVNQQFDEAFSKGLKNEKKTDGDIERLNNLRTSNAELMIALSRQMYQGYQSFVTKINFDSSGKYEVSPLDKSNALYEEINKAIQEGGIEDKCKVYVNGKKMPFKSYMEMNARTTLNQEISKHQMDVAPDNGVVFWLCNSFEDCRKDHIAYQGKVYFDERWTGFGFNEEYTKKIQDAIDSRGMKSRQSVEDNEPFLGNCPNCRHEFIAVPISDVVSMSNHQLLVDNNMNVDKATDEKYKLSQEQRLYERKIRHYKMEIEKNKLSIDNAPSGADTSKEEKMLQHNKEYLQTYYKRIRKLTSEHDFLERDYERENAKVIREDLGARYKR